MAAADDLDPGTDPFGPPAVPTLVGCIHCQQTYESYLIEWRPDRGPDGKPWGFWCCPMPGCDGVGFGCDILPIDPDYQDEHGGWSHDSDEDDDDILEEYDIDEGPDASDAPPKEPPDDEPVPW